MIHSFDSAVAEKYGMLEAVLLNHIYYWVEKNKANEQNFHDGHYWTYNSTRAFSSLFTYASERQIKSALMKLREAGILLTGNYNENPYDRTLWYTLSEDGLRIVQNRTMASTEQYNENDEAGQSYNNTNNINIFTDIKPDINHIKDSCAEPEQVPLNEPQEVEAQVLQDADNNTESVLVPEEYPVISLILNDKSEYGILPKDIKYWEDLYPAVDVGQEFKKMKGWLDSNPKNRKTRNGIRRFINSWLAKEQNKAPRVTASISRKPKWEDML